MRGKNKCSLFLVSLLVLLSIFFANLSNIVLANEDAKSKVYIVYLGERKHNDVELITSTHHDMLASILGSKQASVDAMIYSYRHGFSGFAAKLTESQAQSIAELPGVVHVLLHSFYKVQTTRSWDYLGLSPYSQANLLQDAKMGDDVIIGVFDTGIWPESESFNDKGLGPIPSRWKGFCQSGQKFDPATHCNKKLIGARYFIDGFLAAYGKPFNATELDDFLSARDAFGHGTHCASTAGGSFVNNVSLGGLALGTVRGGAPKARVAMYKVGWAGGVVSSADILKAFDEAIYDGVNVLSISLVDKRDVIYYGSFHAVASGITVVCSGGNSGPDAGTVEDVAPWVISVAASTIDRSFPTTIMLGNNQKFTGQSMYVGKDTGFVELFYKDRDDLEGQRYCEDITSNDTWVAGKVVLCFTLDAEEEIIKQAQADVLKAVTYETGTQILNYIRSTSDPKVRLKPTKTYTGKYASTYVAYFSSRGPNSLSPAVLKPDIAAPGVDILAAYIPTRRSERGYVFDSGTSMAAPHVAGIAALLKSMHPNWSPAAIKSALITTAWTTDPYSGEPIFAMGDTPKIADPFDYGGGVTNPTGARNPGLVYDMGTQDYINYLCAIGYNETSIKQLAGKNSQCHGGVASGSILDINFPSITIPNLKGSVTLKRTVTNVGNPNSKYEVIIDPPQGTVVEVKPMYLLFNPKVRTMSYTVTISTSHKITTEYYFGSLTWVDGMHQVRIPITVKTEFPNVFGD
ncbi:Subtilase family protein [Forsythia ovata]|uniref:Subtilase family protein n=1 Tax=Forsythia ovata TaxID=205694 RepID=A0ABD1XA36_9LAMI